MPHDFANVLEVVALEEVVQDKLRVIGLFRSEAEGCVFKIGIVGFHDGKFNSEVIVILISVNF
ncbi:hypothetical protein A3860_05855 [Niastella vici]|uniref:Uncharacterized protein n=1 Tax=Niastella vici TaxID=1703345 RepID=A0A1V9FS95_9BACT|nr:hypothetical protein A3860_05855 [Niastella vici]